MNSLRRHTLHTVPMIDTITRDSIHFIWQPSPYDTGDTDTGIMRGNFTEMKRVHPTTSQTREGEEERREAGLTKWVMRLISAHNRALF